MYSSALIMFREVLEASLIVGIVLSYLSKSKQTKYNNVVYVAIASSLSVSVIAAYIFNMFLGGFTGKIEAVFEGVVMLVAAALITSMVFWMMKQNKITESIEKRIELSLTDGQRVGLFFTVFLSIFREGIETVIFLSSAALMDGTNTSMFGALIGMILAVLVGYLIFVACKNVDIKKVFKFTSILLIFFSSGLVAHGVHELQEGGVIPILIEHVWDVNWLINEGNGFGSVLKSIFGYNGNPSLLESTSYVLYMFIVMAYLRKASLGNDTSTG